MTSKEIQANSQEELNGKSLLIREYIKNGATANVFQGKYQDREVAVKAMRAGAREGFLSEFKKEVENMQLIWERWNARCQGSDQRTPEWDTNVHRVPQVIPELYGYDVESDFPVLVEEFIDGKSLKDAIAGLPGGVFSEEQAFFLASQIGRALVILHEDLQKSYADIKFNNFLIVGDAAKIQPILKILDWNILGENTERNTRRDLFIVSCYLLFMLTGKLPDMDDKVNLQIKTQLPKIQGFAGLTAGTRRFLERALHPVLEQRYPDAQNWLRAAFGLLELWREYPAVLMPQAKNEFDENYKDSIDVYWNALERADILVQKKFEGAESLRQDILEKVQGDTIIKRIQESLWQQNTSAAVKYFDEVCRKEHYKTNEQIVLWGWLAKAASKTDSYASCQTDLETALQARLDQKFDEASKLFMELIEKAFKDNPHMDELAKESQALSLLTKASGLTLQNEDDIKRQIDLYDQVLGLSIPGGLSAIRIDVWHPTTLRDGAQAKLTELKEALDFLCKAKEKTGASKPVENIRQALEKTPAPAVILTPLKEMIQQALDEGKYDAATDLAQVPVKYGWGDEWFDLAVKSARRLSVFAHRVQGLTAGLHRVKPLSDYLVEVKDTAKLDVNLTLPKAFISLAQEIMQAIRWQSLSDPDLEGLVSGWHTLAENRPEFQGFVDKTLDETKKRQQAREDNASKINSQMDKLASERVQLKALKELDPSNLEGMTKDKISKGKTDLIIKILGDISELERLDPHASQIAEFTDWLANSFELSDWLAARQKADELITRDTKQLSQRLSEALEGGKLVEADILLQVGGELGDLRARRETIRQFLEWSETLSEKSEKEALKWEENIPQVYWELKQDSIPSAATYFKKRSDSLLEKDISEHLDDLVFAFWLYQRKCQKRKEVQPATWQDVEKAASKFSKRKRDAKKKSALLTAIEGLDSPVRPGHPTRPSSPKGAPTWFSKLLNSLRKYSIAIAVLTACFFMLVVGGGAIVANRFFSPTPTPLPTPVIATNPLIVAPPTEKPVEKPIDTPTQTPTPAPASKYPWKDNLPGMPTNVPSGVDFLYLLDDEAVKFEADDPNTWITPKENQDTKRAESINGMKYANSSTKKAYVEWQLDVPIKETGLYAFYINDTKRHSWVSTPVTYMLFVGETQKAPDFGTNTIQLLYSVPQSEGGDWRCIGMYFLNEGDLPKVRLDVPILQQNDVLGADALAIGRVPDVSPDMGQFKDPAMKDKKVLYWADDAQAAWQPASNWIMTEDPATWLGAHHLKIETPQSDVSVTWTFTERLSPGKYEILVMIPAELTLDVSFEAKLGLNAKSLTKDRVLVGEAMGGKLVLLGTIEISQSTQKDNDNGVEYLSNSGLPFLTVIMKPVNPGDVGVFAYDNVLLVKVEK